MPPEQPTNPSTDLNNPSDAANASDQPVPPAPSSVITPTGQAGPETAQPAPPSVPQIQAQPSAPAQNPGYNPQQNPAQPAGPVVASGSNGVIQPSGAKPKRRRLTVLLLLLVIVILAAVGAYFVLKKPATKPVPAPKSTKSQVTDIKVKIPSDWQKLDTGLGFSISAPAGWTVGTSATADINNLNSANVPITANATATVSSTPQTSSTPSSNASSTDASQAQISSQVLEASSEKLDTGNSEAAFKKKVTQLGSDDAASLKTLGIDTSKVTITSKSIKINGTPWTQVATNIPSQYSETIYYWDKDHAIALTGVDATQAKAQQLLQTYLLPMAASLVIKTSN